VEVLKVCIQLHVDTPDTPNWYLKHHKGLEYLNMAMADLEYLHGLLPIEVVIADEGGHAPFKILKSVLMMTTVTTNLFV
jgi:hypothetical protein